MELDPRESRRDPYSDYYTTGGCYRPPRQPKNHGWLLAVVGVLLLCTATAMGLGKLGASLSEQTGEAAASAVEPRLTAVQDQILEAQPSEEPPATPTAQPEDTEGFVLSIQQSQDQTMTLQEIYKKLIPSVASITAVSSSAKSTGTGIIMSEDGYIVTNYHVVSGAERLTVLLTSEEEYPAALVGGDETSDLAVLKINAQGLTPAAFGSSDTAEVGDAVVAIGDPLGTELRGTMTDGIICGIHRDVEVGDRTMTLMQTNAALNSGNSGGPLVNMAGQVIGINTMKISSYYSAVEGIGFAIPSSAAEPIIQELVEKGYVSGRPAFGFTVETLSTQMRLFYNLPGSLCIRSVAEGSDASQQGLTAGDVIIAIEGTQVSSMDEFNRVKNQFSAGDTVTLTVFHRGEQVDVAVKLMDRAELQG